MMVPPPPSPLFPRHDRRTNMAVLVYLIAHPGELRIGIILRLDDANFTRDNILRVKGNEAVPMIVVGNKKDLEGNRQVPTEEAKRWTASHGLRYIETSAKTNENVDDAFLQLSSMVFNQKRAQRTQKANPPNGKPHRKKIRCDIL
ncbi:unnamed protein product [Dibothriocephalus latus]|uniref:Uncharacterized protein n=1 Tax=Dibothriocephalus latus TaxID=60516 RepID=A0A3P7KYS8_DIBLA|nr:unnamed protein product [Dibothriocephalus latus]